MINNAGKFFEKSFADSAKEQGVFCYRLKDTDISFNGNSMSSFTPSNPCDYFLFGNTDDNSRGNLFAIECKSTKYMSMSIESGPEKTKGNKMIRNAQIQSLIKLSFYDGIKAGFVLNFRDEDRNLDDTYYMSIRDFVRFLDETKKKSINKMDCELRAIKIDSTIKRTHYRYDVSKMIKDIAEKGEV